MELDTYPWVHDNCGYEWCDDFGGRFTFNNGTGNSFSPREGFDQDKSHYAKDQQ